MIRDRLKGTVYNACIEDLLRLNTKYGRYKVFIKGNNRLKGKL